MRAVGLGVVLMRVATAASAQDQTLAVAGAFRVSWDREPDPVDRRIEGRVHNDSLFPVTDVRLEVQGLDAGGRPVGRTSAWALGDIAPAETRRS